MRMLTPGPGHHSDILMTGGGWEVGVGGSGGSYVLRKKNTRICLPKKFLLFLA